MPRRDDDEEDDFDGDDEEVDVKRKKRKRGNSEAVGRLAGPAICIMVVASLAVLGQCISIPLNVMALTQGPRPAAAPGDFAAQFNANPGLNLVFGVVFLALQGFILFGAVQMKGAKMYGVSMATAILSVIPICSSCVCFGIPFGIWALIVLMDENVKSAFTS